MEQAHNRGNYEFTDLYVKYLVTTTCDSENMFKNIMDELITCKSFDEYMSSWPIQTQMMWAKKTMAVELKGESSR